MSKFKTIAIIGMSGVGKSTLVNDLIALSPSIYNKVVTSTTRSIRDDEIDKIDYYFLDKGTFEIKIKNKDFIEHTKYNNNFYGTPISSFSDKKINLVIIEPSGIIGLYNHPRINLINIVNIEREYTLILNSINNETRAKQITSRRVSKEEEKEFDKIPGVIKNQIINFENNSANIRYASINFNKTFNMTTIVNLYDYNLDAFLKEHLQILNMNFKKTKNETLKFLLSTLIKECENLIIDINANKEKNDVIYMSKVNSFMDNLEVLKIFNKLKEKSSNQLTKNSLMDIHSRVSFISNFDKIKQFYEDYSHKFSEDKKLLYSILKKDIHALNNPNGLIEKKIFRYIEKNLKTMLVYKSLIESKLDNPLILNSSYLIDYTHIQYNKYHKKHFRLIIDEKKLDLLSNDIIYKMFLNTGKKEIIDVILSDDNHFSLLFENKLLVVFELNENKLNAIDLTENELIDKIKNKELLLKELPENQQTPNLYSKLNNENLLINYNHALYVKSSKVREHINLLSNKNLTIENTLSK